MKGITGFVAVAAVLLASPGAARAAGVSIFFGGDLHGVSRVPDFTVDDPSRGLGFVTGAQVEFELFGPVDLQIGALVAGTGYELTDRAGGGKVSYSGTQVQFPVQARFSPFKLFSMGAGAYLAKGVGDVECAQSGTVTCLAQGSYSDYGLKASDFGIVLSAGSGFGLGIVSVFADLRYLIGLSNQVLDPSGGITDFKQSDFQFLAGVRLGL